METDARGGVRVGAFNVARRQTGQPVDAKAVARYDGKQTMRPHRGKQRVESVGPPVDRRIRAREPVKAV